MFRFDTLGVTYVAVRADAWADVVARWITNDRVNRARISLVLGLTAEVDAANAKGETYRKDAEEARANEVAALAKIDVLTDENDQVNRASKRKGKAIRILLIPAAYGVLKGIQPFVPQLQWIP